MSDPVKVDSHVHLYRNRPEAIREKTGYEVWEYGPLPGVHESDAIGLIDDFVEAMEEAGIEKAVTVNLFSAEVARAAARGGCRRSRRSRRRGQGGVLPPEPRGRRAQPRTPPGREKVRPGDLRERARSPGRARGRPSRPRLPRRRRRAPRAAPETAAVVAAGRHLGGAPRGLARVGARAPRGGGGGRRR